MKLQNSTKLVFALMLISTGCTPTSGVATPPVTAPIEILLPTDTKPAPTPTRDPPSTQTVDEKVDDLVKIIEASDPASPQYDIASAAYSEYPQALEKVAALNSSTNNAASMLTYAMGFPRQDSVLAAQALISLGPEWAGPEMAVLIGYLGYKRPEIRMYTAIILGTAGKDGSCSLGYIGPLLWDPDPYVRTSAALAIQGITGINLVAEAYAVTPDHFSTIPLQPDIPDGKIVGSARTWWTEHGSKVNWHPGYDLCDP